MQLKISNKFDLFLRKGLRVFGSISGISVILGTLTLVFFASRPQHLPVKYKLTHQNYTFYLESADSPTELQKGLKYRSGLASNHGMLFNLGKRYTNAGFWMYKVNFPLDIIFINEGVVTRVINNAPPCFQQPCLIFTAPIATHVLELPSGTAKLANIHIKDKLNIAKIQDTEASSQYLLGN